jgi:hypothetical protein
MITQPTGYRASPLRRRAAGPLTGPFLSGGPFNFNPSLADSTTQTHNIKRHSLFYIQNNQEIAAVGWWVKAIVDGLYTSSKGMNIVISQLTLM